MPDYQGLIKDVEKRIKEKDRLVLFLYLLMRDSLPIGEVTTALVESENANRGKCSFSNAGLEAMANDFADRLLNREQR